MNADFPENPFAGEGGIDPKDAFGSDDDDVPF